MSRSSIDSKRLSGLTWVGIAMFAGAGLSQARVQVFDRNQILERATKTDRFLKSEVEPARRGGILDREGRPLAQDADTRFLTVQFSKTPKSPAFYVDLAAATGIPATEFATLAETAKAPVDWKEPLSASQVQAVKEVRRRWRADGVGWRGSGERLYPLGEAASGIIGAMSNKRALSGIELGFNKAISGTDGKKVGIVDREGNYLPMRLDSATTRRTDGATLTLTIDSEIQQAAAEAVKHAVEANKADQGVAIVMDPRTGDILAMANWPSFDPNKPIEKRPGARTPEFNGAYMAALEPGSTFKVLTVAKALDKGVVQPDDTYYCKGSIQIRNRVIGCDREHGAHGLLDTESAIARSCNLAAANWARKIGHDDFVKYLESLGLMEKPGIGLPQESRGLYNYNDWTQDVQLATNGFGQSMNYTPLALCSAFCMLGNDGKRVHPRLVMKVGETNQAPPEGQQVVAPETAHEVLHMMRAVFESPRGTAKGLRIPGYELGGKTGTAQKKNFTTGDMKGGGYVSNFVGFVPAEQPKAVIMVMIDHPKAGVYYGGTVAGPVFKRIAQNVIRKLRIPKSATMSDSDSGATKPGRTAAPAPFAQDEPQATKKPTRKVAAPIVEVRAKAVRMPNASPRAAASKRKASKVLEPNSGRRVKPKEPVLTAPVAKKREVVRTEGRSPQRVRVTNQAKREASPKKIATIEPGTTPLKKRTVTPQLDELRELGKHSGKPAAKVKEAPGQSRPKKAASRAQGSPKRTASDRVNRSR